MGWTQRVIAVGVYKMESSEEIIINPCPNCKTSGGHTYSVPVDREFVMGLMRLDLDNREKPRNFRVIFRCPVESTLFAVTLRLWETSNSRIERVGEPEVKAPTEKADD